VTAPMSHVPYLVPLILLLSALHQYPGYFNAHGLMLESALVLET